MAKIKNNRKPRNIKRGKWKPDDFSTPDRTDEEIEKLAQEFFKEKIFTNLHLRKQKDIFMVFMPLMFMEPKQMKAFANDNCVFYEYLSQAGPRSINGYPIFTSVRTIKMDDWKKVEKKRDELIKKLEKEANRNGSVAEPG